MLLVDTVLGHFVSSPSAESVPALSCCITKDRTAFVVTLGSVGLVKELVVETFYERFYRAKLRKERHAKRDRRTENKKTDRQIDSLNDQSSPGLSLITGQIYSRFCS